MKNIKLFVLTLLTFASALSYAAKTDYFIALSDFTKTDKTYEATFGSELKCKNYIVYAEVPSAQAAGTVAWRCGSSNSGRFLYFVVNGAQDSSRKIEMKNGYSSDFSFTSGDITEKDGKYYLVFSTDDDYKAKSVKYTLTAGDVEIKSDDATLKSIVYGSDATPVPGFSASQLDYDVELPSDYVGGSPSVQAEANHEKANVDVSQATTLPGTATINVTAEDETTKLKYTVTFSKASANPKVLTATWDNIRGTASIDQVNKTVTGQVTNGSSLVLAPTFTGNNIASWTPNEPVDFSTGEQEFIFSSSTGETETYYITITEAPAMSSDATLKSLSVTGYTINFSPTTYVYNVELKSGTTTAPAVSYELNDSKATAHKTDAAGIPGATKIVVTAEDGTELTYTINFTVAVPVSDRTTHVPGIYEEETAFGGYGGHLRISNGYEYEVYYTGKTNNSEASVCVAPNTQKQEGMTINSSNSTKAKDGWFEGKLSGGISNCNLSANAEFEAGATNAYHKMTNNDAYKFRVQGFDQFSFLGKDKKEDTSSDHSKPANNQLFEVYIDNVLQPAQTNTSAITLRRYNLTTGVHEIEVRAINGGNSEFYGFSLRIAQEPRVSYLFGNDSSQSVRQTGSIRDIQYYTKYNSKGETVLEWDGPVADGIELKVKGSDEIGDTLVLTGNAMCPTGEYSYRVVAKFNGVETSSVKGKFSVYSEIIPEEDDSIYEAKQGKNMDAIEFSYYALSADDVVLEWTGGDEPGGVSGSGDNGKYYISGKPEKTGTFPFTVSVKGGNSIKRTLIVIEWVPGDILYLYKNSLAYERDGIYQYLTKVQGKKLDAEKASKEGLRGAAEYASYKMILISEDVDANNPEILAIIRDGVNLPVLNMKSFAYTPDRLNWGDPNNGSLTEQGRYITVQRDDHPIFQKLGKRRGTQIAVLDKIDEKGLMPADLHAPNGSLCLATALMRNDTNYYGDGKPQTFLHEIPANQRMGKRYICMPIALSSSNNLSIDGKKLLNEVIDYLLGDEPSITMPQIGIDEFMIEDIAPVGGWMATNEIKFEIDLAIYPYLKPEAITPRITLTDPNYTHITPGDGETVDLKNSYHSPVEYVVSDYINRRVYTVSVRFFSSEGIEEVYSAGQWVNIYDIFGRKISTTNEDIYRISIPRGVYIIVTENGDTFKITR